MASRSRCSSTSRRWARSTLSAEGDTKVTESHLSRKHAPFIAVALVTCATFTDIVAYSIAVPVLPDLSRRLGATPTMIGLLFGSFGVTLLAVSVPMGAVSDRVGRRLPLVAGMIALAAASALFAAARSLPWLFAARMVQGAADGVTWVVGFALIADLYGPDDRGRVMGYVMSGTSVALLVGPSIGGWLYSIGGIALPFEFVAVVSLLCAAGFALIRFAPAVQGPTSLAAPSAWSVMQTPTVAVCAAYVVVLAATLAMLEPVLPLFFNRRLGLSPPQIGMLFATAAGAWIVMPMIYGPLVGRWGSRRLLRLGLILTAVWLPMLALAVGIKSALTLMVIEWMIVPLAVTPSLAYMAEVTSIGGADAYGVGFGVYNAAWAIGLLVGPVVGGFAFDRVGLPALLVTWAAVAIVVTLLLGGVQSNRLANGAA
jgi:DHA1 family solute carrier family 18 vesicular amine transporter 1/2